MRLLALVPLLLVACSDDATSATATGAGGSASAQVGTGAGGEDGDGGAQAATTASVAVSTGETSSTGVGGHGGAAEGGGGAGGSTTATTSTGGDGGAGGGGGAPGCPGVPCEANNGYECDDACGNENDIICLGRVCDPEDHFLGGFVEIRTPPISEGLSDCEASCPGQGVWWLARVRVRPGECVAAMGPEGSSVRLVNPNVDGQSCELLAENCLPAQDNNYGEDTFLVLAIPEGMVTDAVKFTVRVGEGDACDGLDCDAAGCNGNGG